MVDILVGLRTICSLKIFCIPLQFLVADTVGDNAKESAFSQWAGIAKIAGGLTSVLAGLDPFGVVTNGFWNKRFWRLKIFKLF